MLLEECVSKIMNYLHEDDEDNNRTFRTRVVNFNNVSDLNSFKDKFNVGDNIFLTVKDYSKKDKKPSIDRLYYDLEQKSGIFFLTGFASFIKFLGKNELKNFISQILNMTSNKSKIVLVCYKCEPFLEFEDRRKKELIYNVAGKQTPNSKIYFISDDELYLDEKNSKLCYGIDEFPTIIEKEFYEKIYIRTTKTSKNYKKSLYTINDTISSYDVLEKKGFVVNLDKSLGSDENWDYALERLSKYESWEEYALNEITATCSLATYMSNWNSLEKNKKWLYFILLKIYGCRQNKYLDRVIKSTKTYDDFIKNIYRNILEIDKFDEKYWELYELRKNIINKIEKNDNDSIYITDFCIYARQKSKNLIYYLTDVTYEEKKNIIKYLNDYIEFDDYEWITSVLEKIYPDLYSYLKPFRYENDMLRNYFKMYNYQKCINKISDKFLNIVHEQAEKRDFNNLVKPRSSIVSNINKENCALIFMDAMGVEYLNYIAKKCNECNLDVDISIGRCELPSLTSFNKEFVEDFKDYIGGPNGVKDIDEIKHGGVKDIDIEENIPLYLIRELEIIKEKIVQINKKLYEYEKVVMISDHGASRLAAIYDGEKWEMEGKGENSGRCCKVSECDKQPLFATEENGYWVIANYDRFSGGRKAQVEVHGGASLEEVIIPIIEIRKNHPIEIEIKTPEIKFSRRRKEKDPQIKLFSKTKLNNISVEVDGKFYDAKVEDGNWIVVDLPDLKDAKEYNVKVYKNNNLICDDLKFKAVKRGMVENDLF